MTIYFFEFPKTGTGISGGERCMLENVLFFSKMGISCVILTTDNGKIVYQNFGVLENETVKYKVVKSFQDEQKTHVFFSYIKRTIQAIRLVNKIIFFTDDVLICNSDFFPNTIPFLLCARRYPKTNVIYWWRVMAPSPFRGFEGEFTGKFQIPRMNVIHYKLNQILYRLTILQRGIIISPNKSYESKLKKMFPRNRTYIIKYYGGSGNNQDNYPSQIKEYDIIWMGRFQKLKGLDDLIEAVDLIRKQGISVRCIVLGGGDGKQERLARESVNKRNLQKNIAFLGFLYGKEKIECIRKSKMLVATSYFESYGQIILEALSEGTPVVSYNLPSYSIFMKGTVKVPIMNKDKLISCVKSLLENEEFRLDLSHEGFLFAKNFSWTKTGQELMNLMLEK